MSKLIRNALNELYEQLGEINKGWRISASVLKRVHEESGTTTQYPFFVLGLRLEMERALARKGMKHVPVVQSEGGLRVLDDDEMVSWAARKREKSIQGLHQSYDTLRVGVDADALTTSRKADREEEMEVTRRYLTAFEREKEKLKVEGKLRAQLPPPS
jgi:hypothetical protein